MKILLSRNGSVANGPQQKQFFHFLLFIKLNGFFAAGFNVGISFSGWNSSLAELISHGVPSSHGSGAHVFSEPLTHGRSHADGLHPCTNLGKNSIW